MYKKGIKTALVLFAIGLIGYIYSVTQGKPAMTAFIPAFFGIPILLSSLLAKNEAKRKLGMHLAAVFALVGFALPFVMIVGKLVRGALEMRLSTFSMSAMCIVCLIFLIQCIQSFKAARRAQA